MTVMICVGRLGADATLRETTGGTQVCTFSAAYDVGFGDKKTTHWVKGVIFGKRAQALQPHLTKGKLVEFTGTPVASAWTDKKSSEARAQIEVTVSDVILHGGGEREPRMSDVPVMDRARAGNRDDQDDDLPF